MSMGDEFERALFGGRASGPSTFGATLDEALQQVGNNNRELARQLDVGEASIRRWRNGLTPRGQAQKIGKLEAFLRSTSADQAVADRWRRNQIEVRTRDREGTRTLTSGRLDLAPGTGAKVVDKLLAGDRAGAVRTFVAGIGHKDADKRAFYGQRYFAADEDLAYEGEGVDDDADYFATTVTAVA